MRNLLLYANYYYNFGFNITHVVPSKNQNKENCRNPFKSSTNNRSHLESQRQSVSEIHGFDWDNAAGLGTVLGFNNLRALDFDGCSDKEFIREVLKVLKLDPEYEWVIQSGSNNGFHILFYSEMHNYLADNLNTKAFIPNSEHSLKFTRLELRWSKHLILPPSLSKDLHYYKFQNCDIPIHKPDSITIESLESLINLICVEKDGSSNVGSYGLSYYENEYLDFTPITKTQLLTRNVSNTSDQFMSEDYDYSEEYDFRESYDKYGGYNGYSDEAIDDAFEGDPMNTWNVD